MKRVREILEKYDLGKDAELDILRYLEHHKKRWEQNLQKELIDGRVRFDEINFIQKEGTCTTKFCFQGEPVIFQEFECQQGETLVITGISGAFPVRFRKTTDKWHE